MFFPIFVTIFPAQPIYILTMIVIISQRIENLSRRQRIPNRFHYASAPYGLTTLTVSVFCPEITNSAGAISFSKIVAERVSE